MGESEFVQFTNQLKNQSRGTGANYVGPTNQNLLLPPQNVSQVDVAVPTIILYVAPAAAPPSSSSSSSSSTPLDLYDRFRNYKFSKDQYGEAYDINELNLTGFKVQLKTTKKSRCADERGMTYGELATRRETKPNPSDAILATYDKTNFGDQYEIERKYRNQSADEINRERDNALEMYVALEKDENLDRDKKEVQNLMRAVENRAIHVPKHEMN
jgi:hypothetical protein